MIKVVLLGSGNVAYHLALALKSAEQVELIQRYSRNGNNDAFFDATLPCSNDLQDLKKADIYLLAIKDDNIGSFSKELQHLKGLVVHTSGSVPMKTLHSGLRRGVVYPVQTFTINQAIEFKKVPLVIEAETKDDLQLLQTFAGSLSEQVFELNSNEREKLHVSAVFANNFSNYMFACADALCKEFNLPFDVLRPIILETGKKIQTMDPLEAQTGPARRNDQVIIEKHIGMLQGEKKEIYTLLSNAITKAFQPKD
ncbi:Rossmann-like and DUF2520 domain-containing protein [Lutimonas sp.]|uniref:Rossmann-like and DUF2520 domain-containing protein n=1 Tax=Lutimonas sp. TaxID=1872403 RepID=UPI003C73677A